MEYYIEDFTEKNYQRLIQIAKSNNEICSYSEALTAECGIILRHDIDFSVHRALALSIIEKKEAVQSTFFVHLHSRYYNVMEKEITDLLKRIVSNGGLIGLHFEPMYYGLKTDNMELCNKYALFEKKMLEELLGVSVDYLSFHNPDVGGRWDKIEDVRIGGMINTYGKFFRDNYEYCSDSNGYWRYQRLEDVLNASSGKRIQILTHPVWWQKTPMFPHDRIMRCIDGRREKNLFLYEDEIRKSGRKDIKEK